MVFAVAVLVIASLQLLFYRTGLGRAFRAVSDDADTAELMGIDNRKLYALALGIAMIFTAIAGVLFGIRTIFDPAAGPIRLILAFEAVIIGGLGSMWGTLIGGVVLGIAQAVGAALRSDLANPRRPYRLSGHSDRPPERAVSADEGLMEPCASSVQPRASRAFALVGALVLAALVALPWWSDDAGYMRLIAEMAYYLALAQFWNLLAGYAGLVSVGQQAYVGLGGIRCSI